MKRFFEDTWHYKQMLELLDNNCPKAREIKIKLSFVQGKETQTYELHWVKPPDVKIAKKAGEDEYDFRRT